MRSIVIEGGSTAYGMHAGEFGGWAMQLQRDSILANPSRMTDPVTVYNHAVPGITLPAINRQFAGISQLHRPGNGNSIIRILSVGINESKIPPDFDRPIVNLGRFASELYMYASQSLLMRAETIYIGPQPIDETKTKPIASTGNIMEDDLLEEYAELIRTQAEMDLVPYVDVRDLFSGYDLAEVLHDDGRHPNEFGHKLIYGAVRKELDNLTVF